MEELIKEKLIPFNEIKKSIIGKMEKAKAGKFAGEETQVSLSKVELSVIIRAIVRYNTRFG